MALEQADYINELDETWPTGADPVSQGDDHLRLLKHVLKETFPNLDAPVTATPDELNNPGNVAGTIQMFGGGSAPAGYLICNGAAVSRTTYPDLYSTIGSNFGNGDGSTTFNVPNMGDRVPGGVSQDNALGATKGKNTHGSADVIKHNHSTQSNGAHTHTTKWNFGSAAPSTGASKTIIDRNDESVTVTTSSNGSHTHTVNNTGATTVDNKQATLYVNYIIKT